MTSLDVHFLMHHGKRERESRSFVFERKNFSRSRIQLTFSFLFADVTTIIVFGSLDRWTETKDIKCEERAERPSAVRSLGNG